jgi:hypothetical protein
MTGMTRLTMPLLALTALLASCGNAPNTPSPLAPPIPENVLPARPVTSPDYYVIGISGKCISDELKLPCGNITPSALQPLNTGNNYNYLEPRGTLSAVADAVRSRGWTVETRGFAASLFDRTNTSSGTLATHPGFLTLTEYVANIYNRDIKGVRNPSRIVLVAHSHGVVWSHLLTFLAPTLPVELQLDFDGVCLYWQSDNQGDFQAAGLGNLMDFEAVCRSRDAAFGGNPNDLQNITASNVRYNLDVHSNDLTLFDSTPNWRLDGTTTGVFVAAFNESHSGVTQRDSQGLDWAVRSVQNLTSYR